MKIKIETSCEFEPAFLIVEAGVRYWEDASVNGVQDNEGLLIPLRVGSLWKPIIELATGHIQNWPSGISAVIHYKVCDAGEYWLEDKDGKRVKWSGYYVPNDLLCVGESGYGDYIILEIGPDGIIKNWQSPIIYGEEWTLIP